MSVNEKMTAIADAIRAKTGGTDLLTLDGMAAAISAIQAGGGDIWIQSGEIVRVEDTAINYGFGGIPVDDSKGKPDILLFFLKTETSIKTKDYADKSFFGGIAAPAFLPSVYMYGRSSSSNIYAPFVIDNTKAMVKDANTGYYHLANPGYMLSLTLFAGNTYTWVAIGGINS